MSFFAQSLDGTASSGNHFQSAFGENPIRRPSGDQNGDLASAVPVRGWSSPASRGRRCREFSPPTRPSDTSRSSSVRREFQVAGIRALRDGDRRLEDSIRGRCLPEVRGGERQDGDSQGGGPNGEIRDPETRRLLARIDQEPHIPNGLQTPARVFLQQDSRSLCSRAGAAVRSGCSFTTLAMISVMSSPWKRRRPVASS